METNSRREPGDEPVVRREHQRFFETIIGALFFSREQHIGAREPDVGRIAAFLDGRVRKCERALEIAAAAEGHSLGREQFGFAGETFQRFIRPEFGFSKLAELDQHPDLPGPGGCIVRVEFQHLGIQPEALFEVSVFKRGSRFGEIVGLVLDEFLLALFRGWSSDSPPNSRFTNRLMDAVVARTIFGTAFRQDCFPRSFRLPAGLPSK